jgi:hypothetical protein
MPAISMARHSGRRQGWEFGAGTADAKREGDIKVILIEEKFVSFIYINTNDNGSYLMQILCCLADFVRKFRSFRRVFTFALDGEAAQREIQEKVRGRCGGRGDGHSTSGSAVRGR